MCDINDHDAVGIRIPSGSGSERPEHAGLATAAWIYRQA